MRAIRLCWLSPRWESDVQLIVRLAEIDRAADDLLDREPRSRVGRDWPAWRRRVARAVSCGRMRTSDLLSLRLNRGQLSYVRALKELMGEPFRVEQACDIWGATYTQVSW